MAYPKEAEIREYSGEIITRLMSAGSILEVLEANSKYMKLFGMILIRSVAELPSTISSKIKEKTT